MALSPASLFPVNAEFYWANLFYASFRILIALYFGNRLEFLTNAQKFREFFNPIGRENTHKIECLVDVEVNKSETGKEEVGVRCF